jgi:hypothetical protein
MFLCGKLSFYVLYKGGDQQTFYKGIFTKNVCWTSANILFLVLRFLWYLHNPTGISEFVRSDKRCGTTKIGLLLFSCVVCRTV